MDTVIQIGPDKAKIKDEKLTSDIPELESLLNSMTKSILWSISSVAPDRDLAIAQRMVEDLGGKVVSMNEPKPYEVDPKIDY